MRRRIVQGLIVVTSTLGVIYAATAIRQDPVYPPTSTVAPAVSGTAEIDQTITCSSGTWSRGPTLYQYQWDRSANGSSGWAQIASGSSYVVSLPDADKYLRCRVRASNSAGSGEKASAATAQVLDLTPDFFVATTGSDANACTEGSPCLSFGRAYAVASPGQVVQAATGTYAAQVICKDGDVCSTSGTDKGGNPVVFRAQGAVTIGGDLSLGINGGLTRTPAHLVFDAITVHGSVRSFGYPTSDITLKNGQVWDLTDAGGGNLGYALISVPSVSSLTLDHMEIGPSCCGADGVGSNVRVTADVASNFVLKDSYIHDLYDACRYVPSAITTAYGACSGIGYGDTVAGGCLSNCETNLGYDHVDGIHVAGGLTGLTIQRTRFYSIGVNGDPTGQAIFLESGDYTAESKGPGCTPGNDVEIANILIESVLVYGVPNNAVSAGDHYCGNDGLGGAGGFVKVLYSSISTTTGAGNLALNGVATTATVTIAGNLMKRLDTGTGSTNLSCRIGDYPTTGFLTPVMKNNIYTNVASPLSGSDKCDATDVRGTPTFVSTNELAPNLHLSGAQTAKDGGEATYCPVNDIDSDARPLGAACDVGGDES